LELKVAVDNRILNTSNVMKKLSLSWRKWWICFIWCIYQ